MKRRTFLISGSAAGGALVEDYTAKKNKDVVIKGEFAKWDDITKKLAADIAAGKPPEIVAGSSKPDFVAAETKRGLVVALAPVVDALGRSDFNPAALKVWQYRGIQMAIPYGGQWPVLWYRKDLFAAKGLKPPITWDDYRAAAEKLTDPAKGVYGAVYSAGRTWNTHLMALIHIWSAGGMLFDEKLNVVFDSPGRRRGPPRRPGPGHIPRERPRWAHRARQGQGGGDGPGQGARRALQDGMFQPEQV